MKRLRALLFPSGWDVSPSQGCPLQYVTCTHLYTWHDLGGKVSSLRKQHDGRDWASNHPPSDLKPNALTKTPLRPHRTYGKQFIILQWLGQRKSEVQLAINYMVIRIRKCINKFEQFDENENILWLAQEYFERVLAAACYDKQPSTCGLPAAVQYVKFT